MLPRFSSAGRGFLPKYSVNAEVRIMPIRNAFFIGLFIILALLLAENSGFAQAETVVTAERLMNWQLAALKDGD